MLYLIRFAKPLGNERHQARLYLGYCEDGRAEERLEEHRSGQGAKITAAAAERGIPMEIVWTGPGDRTAERRLKKRHNHSRILRGATK